jgi:deoxyadenosine/deoxycytidine kinase
MCRFLGNIIYYALASGLVWFVVIVVMTMAPTPTILLVLMSLIAFQDNFSLVLIEGPIGAGKTTLFEWLKGLQKYKLWWRPVFRDEAIPPAELELFYRDQKTKCKSFDKNLEERRLREWMAMYKSWRQSVCDRQLISTLVFARVNYILGNLTWTDYNDLMPLYMFVTLARQFKENDAMQRPVVVVYLSVDFLTCHTRAAARQNNQVIDKRYHQLVVAIYSLLMLDMHAQDPDEKFLRFVVYENASRATPDSMAAVIEKQTTRSTLNSLRRAAEENCAFSLSDEENERFLHCCGRRPGVRVSDNKSSPNGGKLIRYDGTQERTIEIMGTVNFQREREQQ